MAKLNNVKKKNYRLYSKSKLPASDYVINPYIGCTHGCLYCYACFMGRFTGHSEPWGSYLEPKEFCSLQLPKEQKGKTILIGSVTDAYNPAEKTYQIMPKILEVLQNCHAHVEILTKSHLVLRDIELIKKIPDISIGISLAFTSQADVNILEPRASGIKERLNALKILHENGIRTYLFIAPYFPEITNLAELIKLSSGIVDSICVENLNLRSSYKSTILTFIKEHHPTLLPLYKKLYEEKGNGAYWKHIEQEMEQLRIKLEIPLISYFYHEKIKKDVTVQSFT